jgi:hypothetical protein
MKKKTITVDLESYSQPCVLGSVSSGIHPGQLSVYMAGRQTGKSLYSQYAIMDINLCKEIILPMFAMKAPKYKFSRANWYQAEFDVDHYEEVEEWCEQHFGPHDQQPNAWSRWWHKFEESILFRDEQDYILFTLRWAK